MSARLSWRMILVAAGVVAVAATALSDNASAARMPKTWEVQMLNEGGIPRFEPKELTIAAGDTVKWVIVGGSHDVRFWPDSIPAAALELLKAAMPDTASTLASARMRGAGTSYTVVFGGMPAGVYKYRCEPHLDRGMVASITVQ